MCAPTARRRQGCTWPVRMLSYNLTKPPPLLSWQVFFRFHIVCFAGFFLLSCAHYSSCWLYFAPGLLLYAADLALRAGQLGNATTVTAAQVEESAAVATIQMKADKVRAVVCAAGQLMQRLCKPGGLQSNACKGCGCGGMRITVGVLQIAGHIVTPASPLLPRRLCRRWLCVLCRRCGSWSPPFLASSGTHSLLLAAARMVCLRYTSSVTALSPRCVGRLAGCTTPSRSFFTQPMPGLVPTGCFQLAVSNCQFQTPMPPLVTGPAGRPAPAAAHRCARGWPHRLRDNGQLPAAARCKLGGARSAGAVWRWCGGEPGAL